MIAVIYKYRSITNLSVFILKCYNRSCAIRMTVPVYIQWSPIWLKLELSLIVIRLQWPYKGLTLYVYGKYVCDLCRYSYPQDTVKYRHNNFKSFFSVYTTVIFEFIYEHEICFNLCICSNPQDTVHFWHSNFLSFFLFTLQSFLKWFICIGLVTQIVIVELINIKKSTCKALIWLSLWKLRMKHE